MNSRVDLLFGGVGQLIVQRGQSVTTGRFDKQDWKHRKALQLVVGDKGVSDRAGEFNMAET